MPTLSGKTLIAAGQPLANANVIAYRSADNTIAASGTSNSQGDYSLSVADQGPFFIVAYKTDPEFVSGTTRRDLVAQADEEVPPSGNAATVQSLWTGVPMSDGAYVSARMNSAGTAAATRIVVSTSEDLSNPIEMASIAPDEFRIMRQRISGLQPNTRYHYAMKVDGVVDTTYKGRFKTAPAPGPASFTVAFGCCANDTKHNDAAWAAVLAADPLFFHVLGDWTYSDSAWTTVAQRIGQYDTCLKGRPIRKEVHRLIPTDTILDDHDGGTDNFTGLDDNNAPVAYRQTSVSAFRQRFPGTFLSSDPTHTLDHSHVTGRVRFVTMDCRMDRSGQYRADDATKSMLGAPQKARWKAEIDAAAAAGQAVCLISTVPWTGNGWGAYFTEVSELSNYIKSKGMGNKRVFVIAGDMHAMALAEGVDYATGGGALMPVFQVGAMHSNFTSVKGNAYTQGPFGKNGVPTPDDGTSTNYGLMRVLDDGVNLTIVWEGFDAVAGVRRINHRFAVFGQLIREELSPQLKPAAPTAVPGNALAVVTVAAPQNAWPPITKIIVESDAGGVDADADTMEQSHDVTGLANGVPVRFRTIEKNTLGNSPPSDWSTPAVMPTASGGTIPPSTLRITGGAVTLDGDYEKHTFTNPGQMVVTQAGEGDYFEGAGAGSGGAGGSGAAGGGAAGGHKKGTMTFQVGTYGVDIGKGGAQVTGGAAGNSGTDTVITGPNGATLLNEKGEPLIAKGGGKGGGNTSTLKAGDGGSGGGAGAGSSTSGKGLGIAGQGYDGGNSYGSSTSNERAGAGGGGAKGEGGNAAMYKGGDGGEGIEVFGEWYCGGGAGAARANLAGAQGVGKARGGNGGNSDTPATSAAANSCSGGGASSSSTVPSGAGADGIWIVRIKIK